MKRRLPLEGKTVVVTRHAGASPALALALRRLGAHVTACPMTVLRPAKSTPRSDAALRTLPSYDWVVFTSANAVSFLLTRLRALGVSAAALGKARVAAIGAKTAEALRRRGIRVSLVPKEAVGEALAEALRREGVKGQRILIPRARKAREILPSRLRKAGAKVDVVAIYEAVPNPRLPRNIPWKKTDAICFTSGSAVTHLTVSLRGKRPWRRDALAACIGPITARAARRRFSRVVVAREATTEALARAVAEYFAAR